MATPPQPRKRQPKPASGAAEHDDSAAAIQRQIAALQAKLARKNAETAAIAKPAKPQKSATDINAGGGAAVQGSVKLKNGHFIGRDSIKVINQIVSEDTKGAQLALASYLHALATDLAGLQLGEIDPSINQTQQKPLQLPDIYVPLNTTLNLEKGKPLERVLEGKGGGETLPGTRGRETEMQPVSALQALAACPKLTLLGTPGSGKSTFGAHALLTLAKAWQDSNKQLPTTEALGKTWKHGALLPVRVVLRSFAHAHATSTKKLTAGDLWAFIGQDLEDRGWGVAQDAMKFVQRLAREHGALVLLDGLDECGDSARRERVMVAVNTFMGSLGQQSRFLLTARPYAFPKGADVRLAIFELAEFDDDQIQLFVTRWYKALEGQGWRTSKVANSKRDELIAACPRPDLRKLASNPLLLTLMATLHSNRGNLPADRVDLYEETVNLLLSRWNKDVGPDRALIDAMNVHGFTLRNLRSALQAVAFEAHAANVGKEGLAEIGEDRLVRALRPLLGNSKDKADEVIEFIERRAGLLVGRGKPDGAVERRFTLPHRTIQEFLAACHLESGNHFPQECRRLALADAAHWAVVLPLAARIADAERGATAADELIAAIDVATARQRGALNATDWQMARVAGTLLQEIGVNGLAISHQCTQVLARVRGWLAAGLPLHPKQGGAVAAQRAIAGDLLAALGDPRFDPARLHLPADDDLGFVPIPADPAFLIGTRAADKARVEKAIGRRVDAFEINEEPVAVGEFWLARFPVTVAQFQAFVDASGKAPENLRALRDPASRPVRYVSWHEALAYCQWLNQQLLTAPALAASPAAQRVRKHGWHVSLPSELDWELATRAGQRGKAFSWGDMQDPERANYDDSGVNDTSAVGCFEPNAFGLHDLLGNTWEWTRSLWGEDVVKPSFNYPYSPLDTAREDTAASDDVLRVVRGGAFYGSADLARCAFRSWLLPGDLSNLLGFRVVLRSSPV
jgi:formylglycine-generating enzyme required for sulfatase activity